MAKTPVQFRLNGADKAVFVDGGENLLNALRRGIGDMSAKFGCGQGTCGVCTVLIDGEPQLACLTLAETCAGRGNRDCAGPRRGAEPASVARQPSWSTSRPSAASAPRAC